ncbi:MAG: NAD-dependent epimerase/dehydratase family protein [Bacteroidetes bacterium]|nr:NAD-dependent epimerase/dehydratase family protein [Bacteroidota bacterium]
MAKRKTTRTTKRSTLRPKIMVTGAAGALSQAIIHKLKAKYRIVAVDFRKKVDLPAPIVSYRVDFNKRIFEDVFRDHQFDGIIHLGRIQANEANRFSRYNANVIGTQKLFDLSKKYDVKQVLVLSTYFVYGAHPYNPSLLDEKTPLKAAELTMDLVDTVELENLSNIYLYKYPELNITILRPCNIAGPGVGNSFSTLLSQKTAPLLWGFSPLMQFIHIDDMRDAIVLAYEKNVPGIYNVAPDDYISLKKAIEESNCTKMHIPSIPPAFPERISKLMKWKSFPVHLINYFKYPVIIDGSLFERTFGFKAKKSLTDIFRYYRSLK